LKGSDVTTAIRVLKEDPQASLVEFFTESPFGPSLRSVVSARNTKQRLYVQTIDRHDLVFTIGPAGTGKTYLAVAMAAAALLEKKVKRIVLARPAVEAGERLGFLPGDMVEKVNPYLRPLYDALYDILGYEKTAKLLERGVIEVAPIAFMRGRTLNDAFIILDEAQNTTSEQMKMFLTRIGFGSKAVVTGDITQVDLPRARPRGCARRSRSCHRSRGSGSSSSTSGTSCGIRWCSPSSPPTTFSTGSASRRSPARPPAADSLQIMWGQVFTNGFRPVGKPRWSCRFTEQSGKWRPGPMSRAASGDLAP
jgi:hypothetical protein